LVLLRFHFIIETLSRFRALQLKNCNLFQDYTRVEKVRPIVRSAYKHSKRVIVLFYRERLVKPRFLTNTGQSTKFFGLTCERVVGTPVRNNILSAGRTQNYQYFIQRGQKQLVPSLSVKAADDV
jgi:hypothetical protein